MVSEAWPFLPEIVGQTEHVGAKTLIFYRYLIVAPQLTISDNLTPSEKS